MRATIRFAAYLLLGYLLLSLESPMLTSFHIRMYAPDPTLALVIFAAAGFNFVPGVALAACLGFLKDGFSSGVPLGMYVEIYVLIFLGCYALSRRLDYRNVVLVTLVALCASFASSMLFFIMSAIFDRDFEQFDLIFRLAIPQALITAPMGPIVAGLAGWLDSRILPHERDGLFR
jgi:rod shape-determining protein MreD